MITFKLELWRQILETKGFHLSMNKINYMANNNFGKRQGEYDLEVKMGDVIPQICNLNIWGQYYKMLGTHIGASKMAKIEKKHGDYLRS